MYAFCVWGGRAEDVGCRVFIEIGYCKCLGIAKVRAALAHDNEADRPARPKSKGRRRSGRTLGSPTVYRR